MSDDFWDSRPILAHIRDFARARRAGPWAVLGVILARVVTATPPNLVLPPMIGDDMSLNLFIGLVGRPGDGKGAAEKAAFAALLMPDIEIAGVGSGEGIAHCYMCRDKKTGELIQHTKAVMLSVPEVDTLTALGDRRGSTLLPELRKAWIGEPLGFAYADPIKRLPVPAHDYRLTLVLSIQPGRAQPLLDDRDAGLPQRFVWLAVTDPDAPDVPPPEPEPRRWEHPPWPIDFSALLTPMPVCQTARDTILSTHLPRLRGTADDALDSHALLAREKVAAALALLDGADKIREEDWQLSGVVMAVSDRTRAKVAEALQRSNRERNRARGEMEGERAVVVADRVADETIKRVCSAVVRKLAGGQWITHAVLRKGISSPYRSHFLEAIDRLISVGRIESDNAEQDGIRYRLTGGGR